MFKRNTKTTADLAAQLQQLSGTQKFEKDPNEWTITTDKAGNGQAVIRFLSNKEEHGDTVPFVKIFAHSFQDPKSGKWYIENCPTTIGGAYDDCPVCRTNGPLFEAGKTDKATADLASKRSRKLSYWANIVVLKDDANPEAVGKVFKFRFGKKIFEKIQAAATPAMDEIKPVDVTDVFDGASFLLKVKKVSGFPNYDDSMFAPTSELFGGDEDKLAKVWDTMHVLNKVVAPDQFKSTADLDKSYNRATGGSATRRETAMEQEVREAQTSNPTRVHSEPAGQSQTDDIPFDQTATGGASGEDAGDDLDEFLKSLG